MNRYYVPERRDSDLWTVIRRANADNGNIVCRHTTRSKARQCAKARENGVRECPQDHTS